VFNAIKNYWLKAVKIAFKEQTIMDTKLKKILEQASGQKN